jgi:hypothetical protein
MIKSITIIRTIAQVHTHLSPSNIVAYIPRVKVSTVDQDQILVALVKDVNVADDPNNNVPASIVNVS